MATKRHSFTSDANLSPSNNYFEQIGDVTTTEITLLNQKSTKVKNGRSNTLKMTMTSESNGHGTGYNGKISELPVTPNLVDNYVNTEATGDVIGPQRLKETRFSRLCFLTIFIIFSTALLLLLFLALGLIYYTVTRTLLFEKHKEKNATILISGLNSTSLEEQKFWPKFSHNGSTIDGKTTRIDLKAFNYCK